MMIVISYHFYVQYHVILKLRREICVFQIFIYLTNAAVNKASIKSKINNIEQVTIDIDNDKDHDNDDDNNVEEIKNSGATFITTTRATATTIFMLIILFVDMMVMMTIIVIVMIRI